MESSLLHLHCLHPAVRSPRFSCSRFSPVVLPNRLSLLPVFSRPGSARLMHASKSEVVHVTPKKSTPKKSDDWMSYFTGGWKDVLNSCAWVIALFIVSITALTCHGRFDQLSGLLTKYQKPAKDLVEIIAPLLPLLWKKDTEV